MPTVLPLSEMMRFSLLLCLLFIRTGHFCLGQEFSGDKQHKIDSLSAIINKPTHDTALASSYVQLSAILGQTDWDTLLALSNATIELVERGLSQSEDESVIRSLKKSQARALGHLGYVNSFLGNNELALDYNQRALKITEEISDTNRMAALYLNIGTVYYDIGDVASSLDCFGTSARISEELNDLEDMAYAYNNIGFLHRELGDDRLALTYFDKTRQICESIKDRPGLAMAHDNIGHIKLESPDDTTAVHHYLKALNLRESMGDKEGIATSFINLSSIYRKTGQLKKAMQELSKALPIQEEIGDRQGESISCAQMAEVALQLPKPDLELAEIYAKRALALAQELGDPTGVASAASTLSSVYKANANYRQALEMQLLSVAMRDSVYNEENKRKVLRQHMQYEYDKKEALLEAKQEKKEALLLAEQEKKDAIAEEQLHRREVYLTAATIVTFLLGIISLILFFFYRTRTKANEALEKKNTEISSQKAIIEEKNEHITDSIRYAQNLQSAILPKNEMFAKHFSDFHILYEPKDIVSGDFYWMEELNGLVFLAAADCTGHGVPGAMVSMVGFQGLNKAVLEEKLTSSAAILQRLSDHVEEAFEKSGGSVKDGMDICLIAVDTKKRTVTYSGAHNALWILTQKELPEANLREEDGQWRMYELKADRRSIGGFMDAGSFTEKQVQLNQGDRLFLFSDGFADQFGGPQGKKMGSKRMRETVRQLALSGNLAALNAALQDWKGSEEQVDDVTVISVVV